MRLDEGRGPGGGATGRRLVQVLFVLLRHGTADVASYALSRARWAHRIPGVARLTREPRPVRLRRMFEELGGACLKFGQMLALQPDILPLQYCNALFDLLDRVPPFPFSEVERILIEDLGRPAEALFDTIDRTPLASASIGQVHAAVVGGRKVAVKVQRPTARAQFTSDARLMLLTIRLIRRLRLWRGYWLIEPMTEFVMWTSEELDYRSEARYMVRLRRNAETNRHERVPAVLWAYLTPRILVTEFLEGDTVLAYLRRREGGAATEPTAGFNLHALASNIIDNFLGDVFRYGMFHADLHPANLIILPDNAVGYIDFGITGTISCYSRQNIVALTLAYTRGDLPAMCAAFFRVSEIDERSTVDRFRAGLDEASRDWYVDGVGGWRLRKNFTLVMLDMLRLSRETGIWPARDVIKYIRSAVALDGLITRLAPSFDLRSHLEEVCARHMADHVPRSAAMLEAMAACLTSGFRILRTGGTRTSTILERLARGDLPLRVELEQPPPRPGRRASRVVAVAACGAMAVVATALPEVDSGTVTAELVAVACMAALLARASRRGMRTRIQA